MPLTWGDYEFKSTIETTLSQTKDYQYVASVTIQPKTNTGTGVTERVVCIRQRYKKDGGESLPCKKMHGKVPAQLYLKDMSMAEAPGKIRGLIATLQEALGYLERQGNNTGGGYQPPPPAEEEESDPF